MHYIIVILSGLSGMYESHQLFFERYVIFWIYLAMDFQSLLDETFTQLAQLTASIDNARPTVKDVRIAATVP